MLESARVRKTIAISIPERSGNQSADPRSFGTSVELGDSLVDIGSPVWVWWCDVGNGSVIGDDMEKMTDVSVFKNKLADEWMIDEQNLLDRDIGKRSAKETKERQ